MSTNCSAGVGAWDGAHLGFTYYTRGRLGRLNGSWGRKRSYGRLPWRSHNLVLSVKPVMTQLGHPGIKDVLRFDLNRKSADIKPPVYPHLNDNIDSSCQCNLQVIDMLLSVQVNATGPFLDGHD